MADLLTRRCDKSHKHQPLVSGRCRNAAFYPLKLVQTILQGIRDTKDAETILAENSRELKQLICSVTDAAGNLPRISDAAFKSKVTKTDGGVINVVYDVANFRAKYLDEYTGETLDPT